LGVDWADLELVLMCLTLEGGEVTDLVDVPVCWGLSGCELDVLRMEARGGERTGDFMAVPDALGVGLLTGVEVGFRTGGDFALAVDDFGVFTGSGADAAGGAGSAGAALAGGAGASLTCDGGVGWDVDGRNIAEGSVIFDFSS
jgi:hypothetical protein